MSAAATAAADPAVSGPPPRARRRRRSLAWVALVAAVVVSGLIVMVLPTQQWQDRDALDPEHPGAAGGMALAQILKGQGVEVEVVRDREEAMAEAAGGTLAVSGTSYLSDDDLAELIGSASRTVLLSPSSRDARVAFGDDETLYAGRGTGETDPECDLPEAGVAGPVAPGDVWLPGSADTACYPSGDAFGLLAGTREGAQTVLVDGRALFDNAHLATGGNASLGLGLLGADSRLVWYVPSASDVDTSLAPPTLGDLTPGWLSAAIVLLGLSAAVAGVWRGRRFGPLVAETLPVTVRGSETLEGRARLYQRANDAGHAADLVRRGAVARMAARLGLNSRSGEAEVADAAAARLGAGRADVAAILQQQPATDADLAEFGDRLRDLEAAVDAAVSIERKTP